MPSFPTESECLVRKRIGELRKQHDTWYDVIEESDEAKIIFEMRQNVEQFILPYFDTKKDVLSLIDAKQLTANLSYGYGMKE